MKSIKHDLTAVASIAPAVHNADATGAAADLHGYNAATILIQTGSYTDGSFPVVVEESDDNTTWNQVAAADVDGPPPTVASAADGDAVTALGYTGNKRYVRVSLLGSVAGTTGAELAASIVRSKPQYAPSN